MFMFTAPIAPVSHAFHISSDIAPALALLAFAAFVIITAISGARACYRAPLDTMHRGQIIASGGPVSALTRPYRDATGRLRCPVTGRFVKAAR